MSTPATQTKANQRVYQVTDKAGVIQLVKAGTQAQALRFAARGQFSVEVASGLNVAELMQAGVPVNDATAEEGSTE